MNKLKKSEIEEVLTSLADMYPDAGCALQFKSIFQLLAATALSAQTTDKRVNLVTSGLFSKYPDAYAMSRVALQELEDHMKPLGMYRTKSKNLKAMAEMLTSEYDGQVPGNYEALIKLPGVGRKTANIVLSEGFGIPRIAVDTHVFRVSNRIGLVKEKDVLQTELALMRCIPEKEWSLSHHRLIWHGRQLCTARSPKCSICIINKYCVTFRTSQEIKIKSFDDL